MVKWVPLSLSLLALIIFGFSSLTSPSITGFATLNTEKIKISDIYATLTTSNNQNLPEDAKINLRLGDETRVISAKEFIELSGEAFEKSVLLEDNQTFGYIGDHQYSLSLDKLGFTNNAIAGKDMVEFELKIAYKNLILRNEKNSVSLV